MDQWTTLKGVKWHELILLIETHLAGTPRSSGLAVTPNHDSLDTILSHFSKSVCFFFLRGCSDKDNEMMIHLCYFSQASKITENHRFLFYQRRLLSVINLMSSHLVKWWRFYWGVEDSTGLFYPLYTVEYHSSKRQNMKKNLKNTKKSSLCSLRGHF